LNPVGRLRHTSSKTTHGLCSPRSQHAQWSKVTPEISISDREMLFRLRAERGRIPTGFVAIVDGQVVGLACLVQCDLDSHQHLSPWLASVLVEPLTAHGQVAARFRTMIVTG
jgi:hypothetical protein